MTDGGYYNPEKKYPLPATEPTPRFTPARLLGLPREKKRTKQNTFTISDGALTITQNLPTNDPLKINQTVDLLKKKGYIQIYPKTRPDWI